MDKKTLNYSDYLHLSELLECQKLVSLEHNKKAHDEMLFIVTHQVYELWFKQIIHELDSVIEMFNKNEVDERSIGVAVSRLQRITEIQKLLIDQLRVLETMTPLDFLDFRDLLVPASGFQSFQFRMIENKLGLKSEARVTYNNNEYFHVLTKEQQILLTKTAEMPTLRELVEKWLERT